MDITSWKTDEKISTPESDVNLTTDKMTNSSSLTKDNILVDSVEILRWEFQKSLNGDLLNSGVTIQKNLDTILSSDTTDITWFIGESVDITTIPLLNYAVWEKSKNNDSNLIHFKSFNLTIDAKETSQLSDRQGNKYTIGDLLLFAFQLQSHITRSQHIVQLGHVPIFALQKQSFSNIIKDASSDISQNPYYSSSELTLARRTIESLPIYLDSAILLEKIFKKNNPVEVDILIERTKLLHSSADIDLNTDITQVENTKAIDKCKKTLLDQIDENRCLRNSRPALINLRTDVSLTLDLCQLNNPLNPLSVYNLGSSRIIKAYDQVQLSNKQNNNKTASANEAKRPMRPIVPATKPAIGLNAATESLFMYLKTKKLKPIIVVPGSSPSLLNIGNFHEFLQKKQLPSNVDVMNSCHQFNWTCTNLPLLDQIDWRDEILEFKVVDHTQVSKFHAKDWYRVVAVVIQGPEWQFANWPFTSIDRLFKCIQ